MIGEQSLELDSQQASFGKKRSVLLDLSGQARHHPSAGEYDRFPEQQSAFRTADVEDIAQAAKIRKRDIIFRSSQGVCQSGPVHKERETIFSADTADLFQLFQTVQGSVLGRLGDIDHTGHHHVFPVGICPCIVGILPDGGC